VEALRCALAHAWTRLIRPMELGISVNHTLPSGPVAREKTVPWPEETTYWVMTPLGVIRPTTSEPYTVPNQTLPSGPATSPVGVPQGTAAGGRANSVMAPVNGSMRPIP